MSAETRWGMWGTYESERFAAARCRELQALPAEDRRHYEFKQVGRHIYARPTSTHRDRAMDQLIVMQTAGHIPAPYTPHIAIGDTYALF